MSTTKKRKATEPVDTASNGHKKKKSKSKSKTKAERSSSAGYDSSQPPFKVICPFVAKPGFVESPTSAQLAEDFEFQYGIKSANADTSWESLKAYKHVKRMFDTSRALFR